MPDTATIGGEAEPFFFGIPLIARAAARDWRRVCRLLDLTLRSVLAQSDRRFRVLLAGHDRPDCWTARVGGDPRFTFLEADWPVEPPTVANDDGGRKKWLVKRAVRRAGGGLLMFLDADDLVDVNLVRAARARLGPEAAAAIVADGLAIDAAGLRALPFPCPGLFDGAFHHLCGSSTVARVEPASADPTRRDPHLSLGSHGEWEGAARRLGVGLVRLPVWGAYLVNTAESHSELHGPYAEWRRSFGAAVARAGRPLTGPLAARFGLRLDDFRRGLGVHAAAIAAADA